MPDARAQADLEPDEQQNPVLGSGEPIIRASEKAVALEGSEPITFEAYMAQNDLIAVPKTEYTKLVAEVENLKLTLDQLDKLNFVNSCPEEFQEIILEEDINQFTKEELQRYHQVWNKMREYVGMSGSRAIVSDEYEQDDSQLEAKEDIRQLLRARDIRDITLRGA
jgi:hypothetical protein